MLVIRIVEERGLAKGSLMQSEAAEGVLAWDVRDVGEGCQAGSVHEARSRERPRVGGAGDLP